MEDIQFISFTIDLVYSPEDGGYYLQEYKHNETHDTRTSPIFKDKNRLLALYHNGVIKWGKWD